MSQNVLRVEDRRSFEFVWSLEWVLLQVLLREDPLHVLVELDIVDFGGVIGQLEETFQHFVFLIT